MYNEVDNPSYIYRLDVLSTLRGLDIECSTLFQYSTILIFSCLRFSLNLMKWNYEKFTLPFATAPPSDFDLIKLYG